MDNRGKCGNEEKSLIENKNRGTGSGGKLNSGWRMRVKWKY
jgi:hypothetical protein